MKNPYKKIKELVAKDNLAKAIELLKDLVQENKHVNYLIIQSARYYELNSAINLNILEWDKIKIEKSQIRLAILNLIDELIAEEKEDQKFIFDTKGNERVFQGSFKTSTKIKYDKDVDIEILIPNTNIKLEGLVLRFLTVFDSWYFSPLRIQKWGSQQNGFGELKNHTSKSISKVLKKLLKEGKINTTTSKKGNPIYKVRK